MRTDLLARYEATLGPTPPTAATPVEKTSPRSAPGFRAAAAGFPARRGRPTSRLPIRPSIILAEDIFLFFSAVSIPPKPEKDSRSELTRGRAFAGSSPASARVQMFLTSFSRLGILDSLEKSFFEAKSRGFFTSARNFSSSVRIRGQVFLFSAAFCTTLPSLSRLRVFLHLG